MTILTSNTIDVKESTTLIVDDIITEAKGPTISEVD
jgi:hypothetical protein